MPYKEQLRVKCASNRKKNVYILTEIVSFEFFLSHNVLASFKRHEKEMLENNNDKRNVLDASD